MIFLTNVQILHRNPITLIKWLHYRPFSGKFLAISKHSQNTHLVSAFVELNSFGLQAGNFRERGTIFFCFEISKLLESLHKKWSFSLRISPHLLEKSLMENLIFLCSEYSYISEHFQKRWSYEVISIKKVCDGFQFW